MAVESASWPIGERTTTETTEPHSGQNALHRALLIDFAVGRIFRRLGMNL
jgi:hypothetical protein